MLPDKPLLEFKSLIRRVLGIPDPWKRFRDFENRIHGETWTRQSSIVEWAADAARAETVDLIRASKDPVVQRGIELRDELLKRFRNKRADSRGALRFLIHLPDFHVSPAGYSLFRNLGLAFESLGLPTEYWKEGEPVAPYFDRFGPTVLLSVDHKWYPATKRLSEADFIAVNDYRRGNNLIIGLSSNHFPAELTKLREQLEAARRLEVGFFYSFQADEFVRRAYKAYIDDGFRVASCEFGANPLHFYPVPVPERDLNYVYLAATNFEKWGRMFDYFDPLLCQFPGLIIGPGWPRSNVTMISDDSMRYFYSRAKIGLNLHVSFQIAAPTELNERAYNLAACGTPQLMDRPALLSARFRERSVYSCETPAEYHRVFENMLAEPEEARECGIRSMEDVYAQHTIFHRADALVEFIIQDVIAN